MAAFSRASLSHLLFVQFLFAALAAAAVIWFLLVAWFPVVRESIRQLPAEGEISRAQFTWRGDTPVRLGGNRLLSFSINLWHKREASREAQLAVEFGRNEIRFHSLLGYTDYPYPDKYLIEVDQSKLEPWWGAWQPWLLVITAVATVAGLFISWAALATGYFIPVWMIAFYSNRNLDMSGAWKLASAALMPGALFLTLTIVAYGFGLFDLVQLGLGFVFHFLIGWIYCAVSPALLPRDPNVPKQKSNPFA